MKTDRLSRDPTPREDMQKLFPVLFMIFSFANMVVCLGIVLFAQHPVVYAICALLYALLLATELRFHIKSPVSISMLVLYIGLTVLNFHAEKYQGYTGIIVFSWLGVLASVLLLCKKPFTAFYSSGRGMRQLHYAVSALWCVTYILSLLASILLMPNVAFLIVPYILCVLCGILTIFLNFFWFGNRNEFQENFIIGEFSFRRAHHGSSEFVQFCDFYAQQIHIRNDVENGKTEQEISDIVADVERELGTDSYIFIATHETQVIGCIRCIVDRSARPFPLENDMQISFNPLRRLGKVLHIGRLAIDPAYRERPDVLCGLFKCFVDLALSKDVSFVVAESFFHRMPTYLKLGLEVLFERSDPRYTVKMPYGYICHPVYLNFSKLIFCRSDAAQNKYNFSNLINKYLADRWYKRNAVLQIFKSPEQWPWRLSLAQIRKIL